MPPPKKDNVHRYFSYNEDSNFTTCNLCEKHIKGKHTSNLKSHLATKHTAEFQIVAELNKINLPKTNNPPESGQTTLTEQIMKICVRLISEHGRPIQMIKDKAFQELLSLACSKNKDSSITNEINVKSIKNTVHQQADLIRSKIWSEVKNKLLSIKVDSVTCVQRKFLGFNIQYIQNGQIVVRNLAVQEVYESQTGSFLKSALEEVLSDFRIGTENIYCICTDNGANMIKFVKLIGGKYFVENERESNEEESNEEESDEDESEDFTIQEDGHENMEEALNYNCYRDKEGRLGVDFFSIEQDFDVQDLMSATDFPIRGMLCAAHTLQLAVKDAIAENVAVISILNVARRIANILRRPNYTNALKSAHQRKAIIDCSTRWTSTYNMLKRLLMLRDFIDTIQEVSLLISPVFWTQLTAITECLKPANEATIQLQRQDLTIGDFYIIWSNCKNLISAIDHEFATSLTQSMQAREIKLLNNDVVLEAIYVDRRLNVLLNDQQCEKAKSLLKETYQKLQKLNQTAENVNVEGNSEVNQQSNYTIEVQGTSQETSALETLLMRAERARGSARQRRSFDMCLNELVVGPRVPINESILNHWNNVAALTSDLATVANTVLAAPSTQVSVERLFSSLKFILNPLRSNLSQRLLRDIMLIRENKDLID